MRRAPLELPPTDMVYFEVSEPLAEGDWAVEWPRERVSGPFARLDLQHRSCVGALFREPLPKLFLVLAAAARHWQGSLPRWLRQCSSSSKQGSVRARRPGGRPRLSRRVRPHDEGRADDSHPRHRRRCQARARGAAGGGIGVAIRPRILASQERTTSCD